MNSKLLAEPLPDVNVRGRIGQIRQLEWVNDKVVKLLTDLVVPGVLETITDDGAADEVFAMRLADDLWAPRGRARGEQR